MILVSVADVSSIIKRKVFVKQPLPPSSSDQSFKPHKPIQVFVADGVAWGGAIHIISKLIHPPIHAKHPAYQGVQRMFPDPNIEQSVFV